jgi:hypothetical protein
MVGRLQFKAGLNKNARTYLKKEVKQKGLAVWLK